MFPPRIKHDGPDILLHHFQTLLIELHLARDRWKERADSVPNRGTAESRMNFLSNRRSSGNLALLEHECRETCFCQIKRSNQSVVARADDDNAFRFSRHQFFHSRRIFLAAFSPEAPMMPPPGWVAEPHI